MQLDLVNADLINFESTHSNTQYTLTAAGKETLGFFKDKITDGIESDVKSFFTDNKLEFRQENSIPFARAAASILRASSSVSFSLSI